MEISTKNNSNDKKTKGIFSDFLGRKSHKELQSNINNDHKNLQGVFNYIYENGELSLAALKMKYSEIFPQQMKLPEVVAKITNFDNKIEGAKEGRQYIIKVK